MSNKKNKIYSKKSLRYDEPETFSVKNFCKSDDEKALLTHWLLCHGDRAGAVFASKARKLLPISIRSLFDVADSSVAEAYQLDTLFPDLFAIPHPPISNPSFTFVDLFAGIGGFHLAMEQLGGKCVFASEWDPDAKRTYENNFGICPFGDITKICEKAIPKHDVLCAGFPCQPFSKAGQQKGFEDETKGTLFFDIERILKFHHTKYVVLENVRNLVAHDHGKTWKTIVSHLQDIGYRITTTPIIVSPHHFGIPQLRERVVVLGIYDPTHSKESLEIKLPNPRSKRECSVSDIIEDGTVDPSYLLSEKEIGEIEMWDEFYKGIREKTIGFPIWAEWFTRSPEDYLKNSNEPLPSWKKEFIKKNNALYLSNKAFIDRWLIKYHHLDHVSPTMHKMEWQCGDDLSSVWEALMQKRPSGLRVKRPDCAPALVAIVQVPIIGWKKRRMTVREAARLQSFPDDFIPCPVRLQAYKQFGNAVNVQVIRRCAEQLLKIK